MVGEILSFIEVSEWIVFCKFCLLKVWFKVNLVMNVEQVL